MIFYFMAAAALNCGTAWRSSTAWNQAEVLVFKGGMLGVEASVCVKRDCDDLLASVRLTHVLRSKEVYGEARINQEGELIVERIFANYLRRRCVALCAIEPEPDGSAIAVVAAVPVVGHCRVLLLRQS